jgi:FkbM family methyltransferase
VTAQERGTFFDQAREHTPFVGVQTPDGLSFIVSTQDASVGRSLFVRRQRSEFRMLATALKVLRENGKPHNRGVFVDVGANIGTTTVAALVLHGFASGIAFEPEPLNVSLLRVNLALNGLNSRVRVVEAAVSDSAGCKHLGISKKHGSHKIKREGLAVEAVTLDDEITDDVGLIWIDVQGHEGRVFRGGRGLFSRLPPVVVEVSPAHLQAGGTYAGFLEIARGYEQFVIPGKHAVPRPTSKLDAMLRQRGKRHLDILLVP